jgi:anti-sigma28 factor (negative regulator of flagellin synthesis)
MKINGGYFEPLRPTPSGTPAVQRPAQEVPQPNAVRPAKSDSVQISTEGRRMQTQQRDDALEPDRVAELRNKVLTGAYNTLDVVDQVARRILTRGDL